LRRCAPGGARMPDPQKHQVMEAEAERLFAPSACRAQLVERLDVVPSVPAGLRRGISNPRGRVIIPMQGMNNFTTQSNPPRIEQHLHLLSTGVPKSNSASEDIALCA
jgi:hypothetical protein